MNKILIFLTFLCPFTVFSQPDSTIQGNAAQTMMKLNSRLTIGGYGQVDYNQAYDDSVRSNGKLDVHRLVLLFGYKFNSKLQFITEIEVEHVKEIFVEQAFVNYEFKPEVQFRAGLLLVPMGIINEYHEPPTFNGVERPNLDKIIVPSTWREIGFGFTGRFAEASLSYDAYLMNGFKSYSNQEGILQGSSGLRSGRQKGAEAIMSSPSLALKLNYYGLANLKVSASGYFGKTSSDLYNGIGKNDKLSNRVADSSAVGINMVGLTAQYQKNGFQFRGQFNLVSISNTDQYNAFSDAELGSSLIGGYAEVSYDLLAKKDHIKHQLIPFIRIENYDTHYKVEDANIKNLGYNRNDITLGIGWKPSPGVAFKLDHQWQNNALVKEYSKTINAGVGVWFY